MKCLTSVFLVVLTAVLVHHGWRAESRAHTPRSIVVLAEAPPAPLPPMPRAFDSEREPADGLPVPIYPGTRVTEAEIEPPQPRSNRLNSVAPGILIDRHVTKPRPTPNGRTVSGQLCGTEPRARANARVHLEREVTDWLAPDVPSAWKPPAYLVDRLIKQTRIEPVVRDYGTLYEATLDVDFGPGRRREIVEAYQQQLVKHRMTTLGAGLGFVLACLAALSGYIRADEATKGYYTHWLRAMAAAGVGASGVLLYQLLA